MSERYSPDTHPNQIKEQTNDKQYLELYNAAQRCFNLTANRVATTTTTTTTTITTTTT